MDIFDCTASGSGAAFLPVVLPNSRTRRFPGAGQHTSSPAAAAAHIPAGRPSSISPGSRPAGVGGAAGAQAADGGGRAAAGGWRRPRHPPSRAALREPTRKQQLRVSTISLFNRILHTLCSELLPGEGQRGRPPGQSPAGVPQCCRRTPCRPARRPLRSRIAADPTAKRGSSEAPRSTKDSTGRGRAPAGRHPSIHPPPRPSPLPVTCHDRRRLRRSGGGASPSYPPATADVRSLQLASPAGAGGQKQPQQK